MLRLRSEKILFTLAVFFFILAWIFKGWIFVGLAAIVTLLGLSVTAISSVVEIRMAKGNVKMILFCAQCEKLLPLTPHNYAPEYSAAGGEIPKNDINDFLRFHYGHEIKYLEVVYNGPLRENPVDPIFESYLLARWGKQLFFIKRGRLDIRDPLKYEIGLMPRKWKLFSLVLR